MPQKYLEWGVYTLYLKFSYKINDDIRDFMRTWHKKEEKDNK